MLCHSSQCYHCLYLELVFWKLTLYCLVDENRKVFYLFKNIFSPEVLDTFKLLEQIQSLSFNENILLSIKNCFDFEIKMKASFKSLPKIIMECYDTQIAVCFLFGFFFLLSQNLWQYSLVCSTALFASPRVAREAIRVGTAKRVNIFWCVIKFPSLHEDS